MKDDVAPVRSKPREVVYDRGTHWRAKLGFLINTNELVVEENLFRMAPEGVGVYMTRLRTSRHITVDGLAAAFGGGGHRYAAGCVLEPPIEDAERRVLAGLKDLVSNAPSDQ